MSLEITQRHALLSTAPQACPEDMAQVAQAGFKSVMNNRPDFEHEATQPTASAVRAAAQEQGMAFINLPFSPAHVDTQLVAEFARQIAAAPKPILVYCRSGSRSTGIFQNALERGLLNHDDLALID